MKITTTHYQYMLNQMRANAALIPALREQIANDPRARDREKRLRWDLCYSAGLSRWICDNVYSYADDTHVDTALRKIMADLNG